MTRSVVLVLAIGVTICASLAAQQAPVFRAGRDAVVVDVSVMDGRTPILNLGVDDFALFDDGVPQAIDDVVMASGPIAVSVVLDTSGSLTGILQEPALQAVRDVAALLNPDDNVQLMTFGDRAEATDTIRLGGLRLGPPRIGDGGSSVFDSIAVAAMRIVEPGRRHLVVVVTDGIDTGGIIGRAPRLEILERSSAVVYLVAFSTLGRTSGFWTGNQQGSTIEADVAGDFDYLYREIADATSGRFFDIRPGLQFADTLRDALVAFRQRYLLRYQPAGVGGEGWHELSVRVRDYDVRARRGYFRGGAPVGPR